MTTSENKQGTLATLAGAVGDFVCSRILKVAMGSQEQGRESAFRVVALSG
jgi:hypothetical protein